MNFPAFPGDPNLSGFGCEGLSKRELFAAMAMQGLMSIPEVFGKPNLIAGASVEIADALIAELEKGGAK